MVIPKGDASFSGEPHDEVASLLALAPPPTSTRPFHDDDDDYFEIEKEFERKIGNRGSSAMQAFFSMAKSSVGAGSFALPWAISQSGLYLGILGLCVISVISLYTMKLMIQTKKLVNLRRAFPDTADSYAEVAQVIAPKWGPLLVQTCVFLTCCGVTAGYLIFVGLNLRSALLHLLAWKLTLLEVYTIVLPLVIGLTFLPSFKSLAKAAYIGSLFLVFAVVFTYVSAAQSAPFFPMQSLEHWKWDTFPLFFGIAVFLFGVHAMAIPLEQDLRKPEQIGTVFNAACAAVLGINLPFAVFGYIAFGRDVQGYIFCNLPHNTFLHLVQLSLSVELILSIPIVLLPAPLAIEEFCQIPQHCETWIQSLKQKSIRASLVLGSWGLAILVPIFEDILSLVGGLSCATIAFVLPPLFSILICSKINPYDRWNTKTLLHILLLIFGLSVVVATTYLNVKDILHKYQSGDIHGIYSTASDSGSC